MRIAIVSVFVDYHRKGHRHRVGLQPQIGPLIAGLLPHADDIEIINESWREIDWRRDYDIMFLSCLHPDFDRAKQISHYFRKRGAKTILGGPLASSYPELCQAYFDAIIIGDPEGAVERAYSDFCRGRLQTRYRSPGYRADQVRTPRFDLIVNQAQHPLCFEATRGCPFSCDFCVLTALGSRYETRAVASVLSDIAKGQAQLRGRVADYKLRMVGFCDNNIGGSFSFLRELCAALEPLQIQWYGAATFNVISKPDMVKKMARSGCRALFVGLESFNPHTLVAMNKQQNVLHKIRSAIEMCRDHGILVVSGLMVSPQMDTSEYLHSIPQHLRDCGLNVPTFIAFETPIPGTPQFTRMATQPETPFMPNALLRDFAGYTLVVKPAHMSPELFVETYHSVSAEVFSLGNRLRKLLLEVPGFLRRGLWLPALIDVTDMHLARYSPAKGRTYLAGSDLAPSESVPLTDSDFNSEEERAHIMAPTRVTDARGRVAAEWHHSVTPHAVPKSVRPKRSQLQNSDCLAPAVANLVPAA